MKKNWGAMKATFAGGLAVAMALALTSCSSGPSEGDAKEAVVKMLKQVMGVDEIDIKNFKVSGCTKAEGADGYKCDTSGEVVWMIGRASDSQEFSNNYRYSKSSGEWKAYPR